MEKKNNAHVCIRSKEFVISGYESTEYMQKVAAYLNNKMEEVKSVSDFPKLDRDMRDIMLEINITDELFKAKSKIDELESVLEKRDEELYSLRHKYIALETKVGELQERLDKTEQINEAAQKKPK